MLASFTVKGEKNLGGRIFAKVVQKENKMVEKVLFFSGLSTNNYPTFRVIPN